MQSALTLVIRLLSAYQSRTSAVTGMVSLLFLYLPLDTTVFTSCKCKCKFQLFAGAHIDLACSPAVLKLSATHACECRMLSLTLTHTTLDISNLRLQHIRRLTPTCTTSQRLMSPAQSPTPLLPPPAAPCNRPLHSSSLSLFPLMPAPVQQSPPQLPPRLPSSNNSSRLVPLRHLQAPLRSLSTRLKLLPRLTAAHRSQQRLFMLSRHSSSPAPARMTHPISSRHPLPTQCTHPHSPCRSSHRLTNS